LKFWNCGKLIWGKTMTGINRESAALIVVDAQNFILNEKGLNAEWGVLKHAKDTDMIENTKEAIAKAREYSIPIIYLKVILRPQTLHAIGFWKPLLEIDFSKISPEEEEFQTGFVEELAPRSEDFIVVKYNAMNGFFNTDLEQILKGLKRDTLVFTGAITNLCLETTVRGAFDRGYNIIVLSNCTASINAELQKFSIEVVFPMLGEVCTLGELEIVS
jgi:ureidoacrylate peracid hydrolase